VSACGWQADEWIIAQRGDGFQCHVAGSLDGSLVILLQEQCAYPPDDGIVVGEDADDFSASLDLAVETLDQMGRMKLCPVLFGKAHAGEHIDVRHDPSAWRVWAPSA